MNGEIVLRGEIGGFPTGDDRCKLAQIADLQRGGGKFELLPAWLAPAVDFQGLYLTVSQMATPQVGDDACSLGAVDFDPAGVGFHLQCGDLDDAPALRLSEDRDSVIDERLGRRRNLVGMMVC